jgi:hypothetical protein
MKKTLIIIFAIFGFFILIGMFPNYVSMTISKNYKLTHCLDAESPNISFIDFELFEIGSEKGFRAIDGYVHQIGFKGNLYFFFVKMNNSEDKSGWYSVDIDNKNILLVEEEAFSEKLVGEKYGIQVTSIYDFYKKNNKLFSPDWRRSYSGPLESSKGGFHSKNIKP